MRPFRDLLFLHGFLLGPAAAPEPAARPSSAREVVLGFLTTVRSGAEPDRAPEFLAPRVVAHQLVSEKPESVVRTPAEYAAHVRDFLRTWGPFELEVTELLADGDRVYARWLQRGRHLADVDGHAPTGRPTTELASAVYRVEGGLIVEYWIQIDRAGTEAQLRRDAQARAPRSTGEFPSTAPVTSDAPTSRLAPGSGDAAQDGRGTSPGPRERFGPC